LEFDFHLRFGIPRTPHRFSLGVVFGNYKEPDRISMPTALASEFGFPVQTSRSPHAGGGSPVQDLPDCFPDGALAIDVGGMVVEECLAPLLLDVVTKTAIRCGHVHTLQGEDEDESEAVVEFIFVDPLHAAALLKLFMVAAPLCIERFNDPEDEYWVARTDQYDEDTMITVISVPRDAVDVLTADVHQYLYPNGMVDFADIDASR
jgi:hypothetical protein